MKRGVILCALLSLCLLMSYAPESRASEFNSHAEHVVLSLPAGVFSDHRLEERGTTLAFTFSGLSVIQLQEHCVQSALGTHCSRLVWCVEPAPEGASLVFDVARFSHPTVTVASAQDHSHVVIGVCDQKDEGDDSSCLREMILQNV